MTAIALRESLVFLLFLTILPLGYCLSVIVGAAYKALKRKPTKRR